MLLFIDNFDSFTYNLVQMFQVLGVVTRVVRHSALSVAECATLQPSYIAVGPGPGDPAQAGISKELISRFAGQIPLLGICLGHQCMAEVFGGRVVRAKKPMHGKTSHIQHDGKGIFAGVPQGFVATRYHSLIVERSSLPACLQISAETEEGEIMGLRHANHPSLEGVQFHPESVLTEAGKVLLSNFLKEKRCLTKC